jgi:mitochondrial chaperone BCS1
LNSIVLDDGIKEFLLEDARDFMNSKQWYAERGTSYTPFITLASNRRILGIPFRRGYLLYGSPGSGKTSIIHSLAGELGIDIYIISLSKTGLDDSALNSLIASLPEECIAVMEDIDAAFTHGLARDTTGMELENHRQGDPSRQDPENSDPEDNSREDQGQAFGRSLVGGFPYGVSRITLSGLLNALDGISAQEGRLLFATTNRYHKLDPALIRPGRMDVHVEFRLASRYQARQLYKRFYMPNNSEGSTAPDEDDDDACTDSGYVTPTKEDSCPTLPTPTSATPDEQPRYSGSTHSTRGPKLSRKKIECLAEQFSARIPERELSMASLQGYLMTYKTRPSQAVDDVEKWVKKTQDGQDRMAEARAACAR